ncbi:NADH-quinone oxidoreductase subunit N [Mangrovactinospora gilvigrisea]|uniref:NADH-quinone oxidoreductase subunit N n=1 Tax=Mangrovactinospora gilvigrisea TaxID=1428644 RepID=A0A1J7CI26_9ACTN|nr:NADH-quinone oxidoreductase subunit N [Mangrovactinospora gilvigrisea]OIV39282.1 NADH-quinone oxidoreductase subunit N [Mangrovactinospora gilvigrisea]
MTAVPPLTQNVDWLAVAPPLVTALAALAALLAAVLLGDGPRARRAPGAIAVLGLAAALALLIPLRRGDRTAFCVAGRPADCSYAADRFALAFQLLVLGGALVAALLSLHAVRGDGASEKRLPRGEFWFLLLGSTAGAALLPAARDLATLVVALETASLPAFALVGLRRDARGGEAALKFFLSSVAATAVTLLGVSFLYGASGTLFVRALPAALEHAPAQLRTLAGLGAVLALVGFAFKTAAAPFHMWVPDTYTGAPLPVAAYLSVVGKAAGLAGLAVLTVLALPGYAHLWGPALAVLAALTMTVGNAAAVRSFGRERFAPTAGPGDRGSAVRLLAWSSVAQAGYLLVPLAAAGHNGRLGRATGSLVAFALLYAVVNLGAFAVLAVVGRDRGGLRLDDHRGLFARRPVAALALAFFLLSLAGVPPGVVGLFGKLVVLRSAVDAGLGWLAVVVALNSVAGLYYYALWTVRLFAPAPAGERAASRVPVGLAAALAVTAVLGAVLSAAPELALRLTSGTLLR